MEGDNKLAEQIEVLKDQERHQNIEKNSQPSESVAVGLSADKTDTKMKIDPIVLFQQIEKLREEGVDEETIKSAFSEFMGDATGNVRRAKSVMKRTVSSTPMPTQEEINKIYEDRYKNVDTEISDPSVAALLAEIERSKEIKARTVKVPLNVRLARYVAIKVLASTIFFCKLLGVK